MIRLPWLQRRRSTIEQDEFDRLCNQAILAWVRPGQSDQALLAFLTTVDPHFRKEVEQQARALFQRFERLLSRSRTAPPVQEPADIERLLLVRFPWMSAEAFSRLDSYGQWMSWHG